jgi:hypothetical protein
LGLGFVLSCANLDFIALNLSVWREKKYEKRLKGKIVSLSLCLERKKKYEKWLKSKIISLSLLALCLSVLSCANCQLPFASVLLKKKMKNGGWKGQRWTLMRERIN